MSKLNNKSQTSNDITVKEASSHLGISESTVKKYLKDFSLLVEKGSGSKALITQETFQALSEIAKLRANGMSIQEIKELKAQNPSVHILDEIESAGDPVKIEPSSNIEKSENESIIESEKNGDYSDVPIDEQEQSNQMGLEESSTSEGALDTEKETVPDVEENKREDNESDENEQPESRRRRGFNYRYVERQISTDSKKISAFRRRLQNPNISIQERLFYEDALERRILFLNGWKHILKWVSKQ